VRANRLREVWERGHTALNGWLTIPSSISAEAMAHVGWDSVTVDLQHGLIGLESAVAMIQAVSATTAVPFVRVPWLDPASIMKVLDAGCYGVICPMVNTPADAEALVGACRYPPEGFRSFAPPRAASSADEGYTEKANHTVMALAMIETVSGFDELADIIRVPGLDGVFVGPADLALAFGKRPELGFQDPEILALLVTIAESVRALGKTAGIYCATAGQALRMVSIGYDFVTVGSDLGLLTASAHAALDEVRQALQ